MAFLWHNSLNVFISSTLYVPPLQREQWLNLRLRLTFTTSQDALRKGGTGWSLSPAGQEQAGIMSVRVGRWPHSIVPSTCIYVTAPAPPVLVRLERKRCGQTDLTPPFPFLLLSLGRSGGETGQSSDLISEEGKEKGGERRIRVLPLLYFILSPLLTVTQACVLWMPQRWSYYTHKAEPVLILLLFCSVTIQGSFYAGLDSDKCSSRETKRSTSYATCWAAASTSAWLKGFTDWPQGPQTF